LRNFLKEKIEHIFDLDSMRKEGNSKIFQRKEQLGMLKEASDKLIFFGFFEIFFRTKFGSLIMGFLG